MSEQTRTIRIVLEGEPLGAVEIGLDGNHRIDLPEPHRQKVADLIEEMTERGVTDLGEVTLAEPRQVPPQFLAGQLWRRLKVLGYELET